MAAHMQDQLQRSAAQRSAAQHSTACMNTDFSRKCFIACDLEKAQEEDSRPSWQSFDFHVGLN